MGISLKSKILKDKTLKGKFQELRVYPFILSLSRYSKMIRIKLSTKLSLLTSILMVVIISSLGVIFFVSERNLLINETTESQIRLIRSLLQVGKDSWTSRDPLIGINYVNTIKRDNKSTVYVLLSDAKDIITAHSDSEFIGRKLNAISVQPKKEIQHPVVKEVLHKNQKVYDILMPMFVGERFIGLANIGFSAEIINQTINTALIATRNRILLISVVILPVGILCALFMARLITKPIRLLAHGAELIGKGKLETKIKINTGDELSWLANKFNEMGDKLKELDEMKNDFVSNITHDLRSPISAVRSYIKFMLAGGIEEFKDSGEENLHRMDKDLARLSGFIDHLLEISRIESRVLGLDKKTNSLAKLVDEVKTLYLPRFTEKNINFTAEISGDVPEINFDYERIMEVFTNLISNALKFTPSGGSITVTANKSQTEPNFVQISVLDTGIGIPEIHLENIFNKFTQVKTSVKVKGTGLGLAIAKGLVEAHGGKIRAENLPNQQGSKFTFTLPLAGH